MISTMRFLLFITIFQLCAFIPSLYAADKTPVTSSEHVEYRLAPGDRIKVTVYGHEDLSGQFEVDSSGRVSLPLVQYVKAANLTDRELEKAIIKKLKPDYLVNPKVSVEILSYRPFYVMGEVKNPGKYPYGSGMTVVNAIAMAGGFTYRAKTDGIYVTRANDPTHKKIKVSKNTKIFPGDTIEVSERWF
jgi:protein involved in polysaccharide export with SLBB domain